MDILKWIKDLVVGREITPESLKDKRKSVRIRCSINVTAHSGKEEFAARVVEMGKEGVRLEVSRRLKPGTKYGIEVKHKAISASVLDYEIMNVWGEVLWCRKKRLSSRMLAGVRFIDNPSHIERSWVRFILRRLGYDSKTVFQKRKDIRVGASVSVRYMMGRERMGDGKISNIGIGGILMECVNSLPVNQEIHLRIGPYASMEALVIKGVVLQCRRDAATRLWKLGIRFTEHSPKQTQILGRYIVRFLKETSEL
jgi:c-di-GMP-binding flagellar brake protein YcgR